MKKRILTGIFATFAAVSLTVPLAACSGSGDTAATTASGTEATTEAATTIAIETVTESESASSDMTTEDSADATTGAQTTASGEISGNTPLENASVSSETLKIDVKGYQVYPAGVGGAANSLKPVVVFYYDATNLGDKDTDALSAWTELFDAYQNSGEDDRNILGQGIFVDESIPAEEGTALIKKGETKSYYKSYELTDDTTSVTLRSHDGLGGAKLGEDIIVRVMS